jgi:hypothetical protein
MSGSWPGNAFARGSKFEKDWNNYKHDPDSNKNDGVGNKVREDHERQAADKRNDSALLPAVYEETEPD